VPPDVRPGPTGLPIEAVVPDVQAALAGRGLAVLQAEPGAGKTTVVPLRLLDEAWVGEGRIVMLEPRRVAARAAAARMAALIGEPVGQRVGYRTRDDRRVSSATRIEVVTEGILTRRVQADPFLSGVAAVIFDEFHERRLASDLGLALTLDARAGLRPDLRILVMSATLPAERVAGLLAGADGGDAVAVVTSHGRTFPVAVRWGSGGADQRDVVPGVVGLARRAVEEETGDVLVFLPGVGEISRAASALRAATSTLGPGGGVTAAPGHLGPSGGGRQVAAGTGDIDIRVLHGSLTAAEQDAALASSGEGRRKVVLSTDLAETSLTVEGVTVVVDGGLNRAPRFDPGSGLTRLETRRASRASAEQRAGRAGRTAPGVVYRWWSAADHATRQAFAEPEILTVDLAALVLELAVWGSSAAELTWIDPPPTPALSEGRALLDALGAVQGSDDGARPTQIGRAMADLPVHPRLARMVLAAPAVQRPLACTLAALLEERDIFRRDGAAVATVDVVERVAAVAGDGNRAGTVDRRGLDVVRRRARELASRVDGVSGPYRVGGRSEVDAAAVGRLVALAYPDRLAQARGGGRFRLRGGPGVTVAASDPLSAEAYLVVADVTPVDPTAVYSSTSDGRVRLAAALDLADVEAIGGDEVVTEETYVWVDGDLRRRVARRLGALVLAETLGPPVPGPGLAAALAERVARDGLEVLGWNDEARAWQHRVAFARDTAGEGWPDVSDAALAATVGDWLVPRLASAKGSSDLAGVRMAAVIRQVLGPERSRQLDQLAPTSIELPSGRRLAVDYAEGRPSARARAQDLFGIRAHPTVGDRRIPVVLHVLSPAGRPVQVTADLPGFWAGSWPQVRREMAGRYPKHDWPTDPSAAAPRRPRSPAPAARPATRRRP
jgi:ATP-dependent helicase HrpB